MNLTVSITGVPQVKSDINNVLTKFVSETTDVLTENLRSRTPIATGRARKGWSGRAQGINANIENRVPYIEYLEQGHSRQAPTGFVRQAIAATVATMNRKGYL